MKKKENVLVIRTFNPDVSILLISQHILNWKFQIKTQIYKPLNQFSPFILEHES